jgi:LysR family transcriptional regulator, glycine cleavage system transcriptional activator
VDRLPLTSVRTFAVVARLLSITRAADELNVTPSAISHQIRALEEYLSVKLFERQKNKLVLTPAGQQYMVQVSEGLLLLSQATNAVKGTNAQQVLRVVSPPSLALLWLVDRLAGFLQHHANTSIHVTTAFDLPPLLGSFDIGFWFGAGTLTGLSVESLGANCVFPICKPSLMQAEPALRSPLDLHKHTLLDSSDETYYRYREPRQPGWQRWFQAAGLRDFSSVRTLNLTPRMLMHQGVAAGLGIGISQSLLAVDALAKHTIAVPFGPVVPFAATYHLVYAPHMAKRKDVAAFREWVGDEASRSRTRLQQLLKRFM